MSGDDARRDAISHEADAVEAVRSGDLRRIEAAEYRTRRALIEAGDRLREFVRRSRTPRTEDTER